MKRQFLHQTGKQGQLRGWATYKVGPSLDSKGRVIPFTKKTGFWRMARRAAIEQFPDTKLFFVEKSKKGRT